MLRDPFNSVPGNLNCSLGDGHEVLPDLRRQGLDLQLQNALLVREAVRGVGKVALGVRRSAHDVLIAQGCLLRLGHFLVGLRDTL